MSEPVVLHVTRPYADVDAYLTHEAWTLDARSMLLVDHPELPRDTNIIFDITLNDGSRPIRAEARVLGKLEPARGKPGGLRVRFKRYGASTKAFIERAVKLMAAAAPQPSVPPQPPLVLELAGADQIPSAAPVPIEASITPAAEPAPPPAKADAPAFPGAGGFAPVPSSPPLGLAPGARDAALDRLRARATGEIPTPPAREFLLERLRQRGQTEDVTTRFTARE